jgi:hypothetical protein
MLCKRLMIVHICNWLVMQRASHLEGGRGIGGGGSGWGEWGFGGGGNDIRHLYKTTNIVGPLDSWHLYRSQDEGSLALAGKKLGQNVVFIGLHLFNGSVESIAHGKSRGGDRCWLRELLIYVFWILL